MNTDEAYLCIYAYMYVYMYACMFVCMYEHRGPELDKIKRLLIENGCPADFLPSCINQTLANFAAEKPFGREMCPVYLNCLGLVTFHQSLKIKLVKPLHLVTML